MMGRSRRLTFPSLSQYGSFHVLFSIAFEATRYEVMGSNGFLMDLTGIDENSQVETSNADKYAMCCSTVVSERVLLAELGSTGFWEGFGENGACLSAVSESDDDEDSSLRGS